MRPGEDAERPRLGEQEVARTADSSARNGGVEQADERVETPGGRRPLLEPEEQHHHVPFAREPDEHAEHLFEPRPVARLREKLHQTFGGLPRGRDRRRARARRASARARRRCRAPPRCARLRARRATRTPDRRASRQSTLPRRSSEGAPLRRLRRVTEAPLDREPCHRTVVALAGKVLDGLEHVVGEIGALEKLAVVLERPVRVVS